MKISISIYKEKFTITEKEKEDYFRWYYMPESEAKTKKDMEARMDRLKKQIAWTKKIANKYCKYFLYCDRWKMYGNTNEIVITK